MKEIADRVLGFVLTLIAPFVPFAIGAFILGAILRVLNGY